MLWIYVPTGLGGIVLTYLLFVSRLVPRAIAVLGLVGYAALTIGVPLDLLGLLDMSAGPGLLIVVPGGLFRLVFLQAWLIIKGFNPAPATAFTRPGRALPAGRREYYGGWSSGSTPTRLGRMRETSEPRS